MTKITWIQIFATVFQLITSTAGTCNETNVGIRDELKIIPDGQMGASTNNGGFPPEFGRLHGTTAWCPDPADGAPHLQIDLGQEYVICAVEAQGLPGASLTTNFSLSTSTDGTNFDDYNSNQQFNGSAADGNITDFHKLSTTIKAQHIRFKPITASICLRVEVYGTPDGVAVTCNENDIQVQIDRSVHSLNEGDLRLIDNSCIPTSFDVSFINFNITLGTCGTSVVLSTDGVKSFYRNEIIINSTSTKKFDIICSYIREPTVASGAGSFTFSMNIFTDADFMTAVPSSPISLKTLLYFKIDVQSSDDDTELHLTKCWATPTSDPDDVNAYTFIDAGCHLASDPFVTDYNCTKTTTTQDFVLSVFRFPGSAPGNQIYFHCNAVVCLLSNSGSECTTECNACSAKRKRRALEDDARKDLAEAHLVRGPFTIIDNNGDDVVDDGSEKGEEAIKDSETFPVSLVVVVCVSALAAMAIIIGLLVTIRLSKSARGPAVKDVTADLARDNLAFDELDVKTLSIKSNKKPI